MGINSHPGSTYGPVQDMDMGGHFEDMPPAPPQDNNQVRRPDQIRYNIDTDHCISRLLLGMTPISRVNIEDDVLVTDLPCPPSSDTSKTFIKLVDTVFVIYILVLNFLRFCIMCTK